MEDRDLIDVPVDVIDDDPHASLPSRRSSQAKTGAPITAVTTPIGISWPGTSDLRDGVGRHEQDGSEQRTEREEPPVQRPHRSAHDVRHNEPHEADRPGESHERRGQQSRADQQRPAVSR